MDKQLLRMRPMCMASLSVQTFTYVKDTLNAGEERGIGWGWGVISKFLKVPKPKFLISIMSF